MNKGDIPKFEPGIYTKISLNDLLVYSIHYLYDQGNEIKSEDVISTCFMLFPRRFSLRKYPHWPDSAVVSRRWNDCRSKGYIVGSPAKGFKLTAKGFRFSEKVAKKLSLARVERTEKAHRPDAAEKSHLPETEKKHTPSLAEKLHPARSGSARLKAQRKKVHPKPPVPVKVVPLVQIDKVRAGKFVRMIEASDAYRQYRKYGKKSKISEFDFRSLLLCTMESSPETLARNVELFKGYADVHHRQNLIVFLTFCEESFSYLLKPELRKAIQKVYRSKR